MAVGSLQQQQQLLPSDPDVKLELRKAPLWGTSWRPLVLMHTLVRIRLAVSTSSLHGLHCGCWAQERKPMSGKRGPITSLVFYIITSLPHTPSSSCSSCVDTDSSQKAAQLWLDSQLYSVCAAQAPEALLCPEARWCQLALRDVRPQERPGTRELIYL